MINQINTVRKTVEGFYQKFLEWDNSMPSIDSSEGQHIVNTGTSVLCTKWKVGYEGGGFVQAIVNNDLMKAVGAADAVNIKALKFYCQLIYNVANPLNV